MDNPQTHLRRDGDRGVVTLTLQHPAKPNPLTEALQRELLAQLRELAADASVRALVITGSGPAFCVGADLHEFQQVARREASLGEWTARCMAELSNPIVLALRELPVPVVCAVNGAAAGAGASLAMAGDLLLMARSAYLYLPFIPRLGLVPDMGASWFLPRQLGRARALGLTLLGPRLPAQQAVQWGLAWACSDDPALAGDAAALARQLAALPPGAVLEARRALDAAERNSLSAQLAYERDRQRELIGQPAFREGLQAFLERREPRFAGRADG